jgi:asparaginyl-tRNA synthetase
MDTPIPIPSPIEISINNVFANINKCVIINGWVHRIRRQGKKMIFLILRDGSGFVQVGVFGELAKKYNEPQSLCTECYICVRGTIKEDSRAPYSGVEVQAEELVVLGDSNTDFDTSVQAEAGNQIALDLRHLFIRGENTSAILKIRAFLLKTIRRFYDDNGFFEITPPSIVNNSCEGGSTLFKLNYFGEDAFLTQSSQLYLESAVPALGKVFCIHPSFRAEKSKTKRHLAEYTHIEMEAHNLSLTKLTEHLRSLFNYLFTEIDKNADTISFIKQLNPNYKGLYYDDFMILPYYQAVELCGQLNIVFQEDDGTYRPYVYGDDLTDKVERRLCEHLKKPVFITQFPAHMKAFYMDPCETPRGLETNSTDLLFPGVGEVVGGSMRNCNYKLLLEKAKEEGGSLDWYLDLRKYGPGQTGGYGIGLERILLYMLGGDISDYSVKDCCLYPRYMGRVSP